MCCPYSWLGFLRREYACWQRFCRLPLSGLRETSEILRHGRGVTAANCDLVKIRQLNSVWVRHSLCICRCHVHRSKIISQPLGSSFFLYLWSQSVCVSGLMANPTYPKTRQLLIWLLCAALRMVQTGSRGLQRRCRDGFGSLEGQQHIHNQRTKVPCSMREATLGAC